MRFEMIFLTAVLGIGAIHLLFSLVNYLVRPIRTRARVSHKEKVRDDDWYVFFKKSDLYGDMADKVVEPEAAGKDAGEPHPAPEDTYHPQGVFT